METETTESCAVVLSCGTESVASGVSHTLEGHLVDGAAFGAVLAHDVAEASLGQGLLRSVSAWSGLTLDTRRLAAAAWGALAPKLEQKDVQVVVACDTQSARVADLWRRQGKLRGPLVGLVTTLRFDPTWAETAVDRLAVVDEHQGAEAHGHGIEGACIVPVGMPVCSGFAVADPADKLVYRRAHGIPSGRPLVLVVTHDLSDDDVTGTLFQLGVVSEQAELLFDLARNDSAGARLRQRARHYGVTARMFGKVDEAPMLWAAADVVLARPRQYIEQRCVTLRLPPIYLGAEHSTEREIARAWVKRGVGRSAERLAILSTEVDLLTRPANLAHAVEGIAAISRRAAAPRIATLIAQVASDRAAILAERYARMQGPASTDGGARASATESPGRAPRTRGPLEVIGAGPSDNAVFGRAAGAFDGPIDDADDLEAVEAETNGRVVAHQRECARWQERLELARDKGDAELVAYALQEAERCQLAMHRALAELARLAERRQQSSARRAKHERQVKEQLRKLEVESALEALKRKVQEE